MKTKIAALLAAVTFLLAACGGSAPDPEQAPKDFLAWYQKAIKINEQADGGITLYETVALSVGNGGMSLADAYAKIKTIDGIEEQASLDMQDLEIPDSLTTDQRKMLTTARQDISSGLFMRHQSLDSMLKYLNDQKPGDAADAKTTMQYASQSIAEGIALLQNLASDLGVTLSN